MIFGSILAGGIGARMDKHNIPKQFIDLCGKPIIIHTLDRMIEADIFDYIIIAIHPEYVDYLKTILERFNHTDSNKIIIVCGGKERIDTIENVICCVDKFACGSDDILLLHDAVRPFVSVEILKNSVNTAKVSGACVAVTPAVDTMYALDSEGTIAEIPPRATIFHGQAPDTFKLNVLKSSFNNLTPKDKKRITGTVQICAVNGVKVQSIKGSYENIKITTENDLNIAKNLLEKESERESLCS